MFQNSFKYPKVFKQVHCKAIYSLRWFVSLCELPQEQEWKFTTHQYESNWNMWIYYQLCCKCAAVLTIWQLQVQWFILNLELAISGIIFKCRSNPNNSLKFLKDVYRAYFDLAQVDHGHRIKYTTIVLLCLPNLWTEKRWFSPLAFPWSDKNQMTIQWSFTSTLLILVVSNQSNCQTMD